MPWIVDGYVNANPPHLGLDWSLSDDVYGPVRSKAQSLGELIDDMDRNRIGRALLAPPPESAGGDEAAGYRWTLEAVQAHPDRFGLSVRVDANTGMRAVRRLDSMVRNDGARALRIVPYRDEKRPTHRSYYPLYAKCIELGIPVTITVGMPAVAREGLVQHPKHLDKICAFFPELVLVSTHGGAPWTQLLVQLLRTWPNHFHMLSAYAPSRYPQDLVRYANSRSGRMKVIYGSDYPLLSFERIRRELPDCGMGLESMELFTVSNASRVFWGEGAVQA
jgi:hypothetical protein